MIKNATDIMFLHEVFGYENQQDLLSAAENDKELGLLVSIAFLLISNPCIGNSVLFFASTTTGRDLSSIKELIFYIKEINDKNNLVLFTAFLFKYEDLNKDFSNIELYKIMNFKTEEDMKLTFSDNLIKLAKFLVLNYKAAFALKSFSEYTTKIEYSSLEDFIKYIQLTFSEEEILSFIKVLENNCEYT